MADATKTVNRFLFVCFRRCKNSSPVFPLAYKSTAAVASGLQKDQTATALLTRCKFYSAAFVSVVSTVCLVHFLTLVSIYPISQITSKARISFLLYPRAWIHFAAFVSVVSSSFPVSACKVITFIPHYQTNLQKSYVKNSFIVILKRFGVFAVGAFVNRDRLQQSYLFRVYVCVRVRMCVRG